MREILALIFAAVQIANAAPPAPSPETVAEWITFSKPVTLTSQEIKITPADRHKRRTLVRRDYFPGSCLLLILRFKAFLTCQNIARHSSRS
jgi:hypothetical protein